MTVSQLQQRYADVFGEAVRSRHKQYLIRRIAWRLQANAEGGLLERALRRAEELANLADVRVTAPRGEVVAAPAAVTRVPAPNRSSDPRLPPFGAAITREYKGRTIYVTVLPDGFEYAGKRYPSLTGSGVGASNPAASNPAASDPAASDPAIEMAAFEPGGSPRAART